MISDFNPLEYEPQIQKLWEEAKCFEVPFSKNLDKTKCLYILDMFPYPSGAGLHVGHPLGYSATDIYARFKKMQGFTVLHPMGFDSFGLPAEQHAIATGEHPAVETSRNCEKFKFQLKRLGFAYDWRREIRTSDPSYYKWTQYIFTLFYNSYYDEKQKRARPISELAIPAEVQNRGPLAVQEYQDQFRLAYQDISYVNYCPELGTVLANEEVIDGKSERGGFDVIRIPLKQWVLRITAYADRLLEDLELLDWPESIIEQQKNWIGRSYGHTVTFVVDETFSIDCFTTRLDTLPGVTFLSLSPEFAHKNFFLLRNQKAKEFTEAALAKTELQRATEKSKAGVFTGSYALNPLTGERVPIYVAEYVVGSYGTGAVMGVPAHDQRDYDFAQENNLPIRKVVWPLDGESPDPFCELGVVKKLVLGSTELHNVPSEEAKKIINDYLSQRGLCKESKSFKLRDWIFSRQRYWGEPIPIVHWENGLRTCLTLEELPLTLPELESFKPIGGGKSPLESAENWVIVKDPKTGLIGRRDTNTMPQWAGSCWYYLRFIDPENPRELVDKDLEKLWMPVKLYLGGAEHAVLHLLYARFWHKFLYDWGFVSTKEPFAKLYNQGMVLSYAYQDPTGRLVPADQVEEKNGRFFDKRSGTELTQITAKMSKSLKNVVDPIEVVQKYGADTLRLYLMFMGPLSDKRIWDDKAIQGVYRFLKKVYSWVLGSSGEEDDSVRLNLNKLIIKVTEDTEKLRFNTAIASMMEFLNFVARKSCSVETKRNFLKLLSPYAPHLSEFLWQKLGEHGLLVNQQWPQIETSAETESLEVVIQVNGKKKRVLKLNSSISGEELKQLALQALQLKECNNFILVSDRHGKPKLINLLVNQTSN
jgi:leucyl-tRNA synthetase